MKFAALIFSCYYKHVVVRLVNVRHVSNALLSAIFDLDSISIVFLAKWMHRGLPSGELRSTPF